MAKQGFVVSAGGGKRFSLTYRITFGSAIRVPRVLHPHASCRGDPHLGISVNVDPRRRSSSVSPYI